MERLPTFVLVVAAAIVDPEGRLLLQQCPPHKPNARANGGLDLVMLLYTCRLWNGEPEAREGQRWGWFARAETASLDLPPMDRALLESLPMV